MLIVGLLLALVDVAVPTATPTPTPAVATGRERRICRDEGPATGSIMTRPRVCHTATEWRVIDAQSGSNVDRFRDDQRARGADTIGQRVER